MSNTWTWVMNQIGWSGKTLVDLVSSAISAAGAALNAVKNAATAVWDGIKAAGQFVLKTIFATVISSIVEIVTNLLRAGLTLLEAVLGITFSENNGLFNIEDYIFGISSDGLDISIYLGNAILSLQNVFLGSTLQFETLSVTEWALTSVITHTALNFIVPIAAKQNPLYGMIAVITQFLGQLGIYSGFSSSIGILGGTDRDTMMIFYLLAFVTSLGSFLLDFGQIAPDAIFEKFGGIGKFLPFPFVKQVSIGGSKTKGADAVKGNVEVGIHRWLALVLGLFSAGFEIFLGLDELTARDKIAGASEVLFVVFSLFVSLAWDANYDNKKGDIPVEAAKAAFNLSSALVYLIILFFFILGWA